MGYCYLFNGDTLTAYDYMSSALAYYQQFRNREADQPRMAQIEKMVRGLQPDAGVLWATLPPIEEQQATRDTLRSRIIDDIDLSDIYEHTIIVSEE
jgi:hypothetical protein